MVHRIKNLQHVSANKLVVSVKMDTDGILTAVKVIGIVVIFHGPLPLGVVDVDILGSGYFVELEVLSVDLIASVARRVIGYHSEVVAVVLSKDGVEGVLNPKLGVVPIAGRYDAHWQLGRDILKFKNSIDTIVLEL